MNRCLLAIVALCVAACDAAIPQDKPQDRNERVRADKARVTGLSSWIYDDLPRAMSEAKASGKPLLVIFRCIPCEACAKLDEDVVERSGPLQKLLDQFVCARIPRANGLDLDLFQFDFDQSWAAFMLNADRTIYGRYGTRSHATRSEDDLSIEGFARALEGALALHAAYPANRAALLPKAGAPRAAKTPEELPSLKERFKPALDWQGNVAKSCLHCHQIGEAERRVFRAAGQSIPERLLYPYPNPKILGLGLDPRDRARIVSVAPGSAADKAGFRAGDAIATLEGQPILSIADVQWVLDAAGESGALRAEISRAGATVPVSIALEPGWRQKGDLSWRSSSWDLRRMTTGGLVLEPLSGAEAAKLGLPNVMLALEVKHVGGFGEHAAAKTAGFKKGDVFVSVAGKSGRMTETELMTSLARTTKPGDRVPVTVIRAGTRIDLVLPMQ